MVESERGRLLRQWWNEPGDYSWVVEFYTLAGAVNAAHHGAQQDEIPFRPTAMKDRNG